jgi:holo-[acyl-carrier protein] synthase
MIIGIGVDVCQVSRLEAALERSPGLAEKLFTEAERIAPDGVPRSIQSLAGRFAAKEAAAKAVGAPSGLSWDNAEVLPNPDGSPGLILTGKACELAVALGVRHTHLSISHDGGVAMAFVVLEG